MYVFWTACPQGNISNAEVDTFSKFKQPKFAFRREIIYAPAVQCIQPLHTQILAGILSTYQSNITSWRKPNIHNLN